MEDKHISNQQSLDLIAKMIESTRRNFNDRGGTMFLIWGYTTIAVTAIVTALLYLTRNHNVNWLWFALPVIGGILTLSHRRKYMKNVRTHLDITIGYVWIVFAAAAFACMAFSFISAAVAGKPLINILFVIGLTMTMATALTGMIIKFKPIVVSGFAGMAFAFIIPSFVGSIWQMPVFAALFLFTQVIPGHMLSLACKKERRAV